MVLKNKKIVINDRYQVDTYLIKFVQREKIYGAPTKLQGCSDTYFLDKLNA